MSSKNKNFTLRAIEAKAESCTSAELKVLFADFGGDPDMVAAMQRGVDSDYASQDRGSYCENASPGYDNACRKRNLMEDFQLAAYKAGRDKKKNAAATVKEGNAEMTELQKTLKDIEARLSRIESRQGGHPKP